MIDPKTEAPCVVILASKYCKHFSFETTTITDTTKKGIRDVKKAE